jgi:CheY-like chemotaxis protein
VLLPPRAADRNGTGPPLPSDGFMDCPHVQVAFADAATRQTVDQHLGGIGCHVFAAVSRVDHVSKLQSYPPDLPILVQPPPRASEADVAQATRHDPALARVPIQILDRRNEAESRTAAQEFIAVHLADLPGWPCFRRARAVPDKHGPGREPGRGGA